ncbi:MAG: hypothetical protein ACK55Z_09550, partial [bacterium]
HPPQALDPALDGDHRHPAAGHPLEPAAAEPPAVARHPQPQPHRPVQWPAEPGADGGPAEPAAAGVAGLVGADRPDGPGGDAGAEPLTDDPAVPARRSQPGPRRCWPAAPLLLLLQPGLRRCQHHWPRQPQPQRPLIDTLRRRIPGPD